MPKNAPRPWKIYYAKQDSEGPPVYWSCYHSRERRDIRLIELRGTYPHLYFMPVG